jgi:hypothetical protein
VAGGTRHATDRRAAAVLAALVLFRIALPFAVLAASPRALPGFPHYEYDPLAGDAHGYHAAMRELVATPLRLGWTLPGVVLALVVLLACGILWRRRRADRAALLLVAVWCVGAIAAFVVLRMRSPGAPTVGWPLVWSVPVLPYRALGLPLDPDVAYGFGLAITIAANAASVLVTYLLGFWVTGRQAVGLAAASLFGLWPGLVLFLAATKASGTWTVDVGVSLYSEPVSTALVTSGCALLVRRPPTPALTVVAGALLGLSVAVRLSNAVVAVCAAGYVMLRDGRRIALWLAVAGLAFLPVVAAYWPKGYDALPEATFRDDAFALRYAAAAWRDSELWGPTSFIALVPLALVGTAAVARLEAVFLWSWILGTALFYTVYFYTPLHPRFLLVVLPAVFVLWGAGLLRLVDTVAPGRGRSP